MKFQKLDALERHFKDSFPDHLCPVYIICSASESERKKIMGSLAKRLERECDLRRFGALNEALDHLNEGSLFSSKLASVFDGVDLLTKSELDLLNKYILSPNQKGYLILGSSSSKPIAEIYLSGKKEIVLLDLAKEKPWEEKERLQKWMVQVLHSKKTAIRPDAVEKLLARFEADRLLLQQEIEKLICYVGQREEITGQDVEAVCFGKSEINPFQLAREVIWGAVKQPPKIRDLSVLLPLVGQLRFQLEMGLKISVMLRKGHSQAEIGASFPRLFPKVLQTTIEQTRRYGEAPFKEGLKYLYDMELGIKTSRAKPEILFSIFCANFQRELLHSARLEVQVQN